MMFLILNLISRFFRLFGSDKNKKLLKTILDSFKFVSKQIKKYVLSQNLDLNILYFNSKIITLVKINRYKKAYSTVVKALNFLNAHESHEDPLTEKRESTQRQSFFENLSGYSKLIACFIKNESKKLKSVANQLKILRQENKLHEKIENIHSKVKKHTKHDQNKRFSKSERFLKKNRISNKLRSKYNTKGTQHQSYRVTQPNINSINNSSKKHSQDRRNLIEHRTQSRSRKNNNLSKHSKTSQTMNAIVTNPIAQHPHDNLKQLNPPNMIKVYSSDSNENPKGMNQKLNQLNRKNNSSQQESIHNIQINSIGNINNQITNNVFNDSVKVVNSNITSIRFINNLPNPEFGQEIKNPQNTTAVIRTDHFSSSFQGVENLKDIRLNNHFSNNQIEKKGKDLSEVIKMNPKNMNLTFGGVKIYCSRASSLIESSMRSRCSKQLESLNSKNRSSTFKRPMSQDSHIVSEIQNELALKNIPNNEKQNKSEKLIRLKGLKKNTVNSLKQYPESTAALPNMDFNDVLDFKRKSDRSSYTEVSSLDNPSISAQQSQQSRTIKDSTCSIHLNGGNHSILNSVGANEQNSSNLPNEYSQEDSPLLYQQQNLINQSNLHEAKTSSSKIPKHSTQPIQENIPYQFGNFLNVSKDTRKKHRISSSESKPKAKPKCSNFDSLNDLNKNRLTDSRFTFQKKKTAAFDFSENNSINNNKVAPEYFFSKFSENIDVRRPTKVVSESSENELISVNSPDSNALQIPKKSVMNSRELPSLLEIQNENQSLADFIPKPKIHNLFLDSSSKLGQDIEQQKLRTPKHKKVEMRLQTLQELQIYSPCLIPVHLQKEAIQEDKKEDLCLQSIQGFNFMVSKKPTVADEADILMQKFLRSESEEELMGSIDFDKKKRERERDLLLYSELSSTP